MPPRHEIETNLCLSAPYATTFYLPYLCNLMQAIEAEGRGRVQVIQRDGSNVRVVIQGSGILLRDTVETLERAGYL